MSNLDTNYVVNLDLVKDKVNSVMKFGLADVETSDFYLGLYNNGTRVFDKNYIVMLYIVKPNGNFRNIELEPKVSSKKYYCNLPDTLKNIPGEYLCQAIIFDNLTGEKKISKSKFKYSVDLDLASEMAGIIDEEEQENILTDILNRLLTLENPVEPYATQKHVDESVSTLTKEMDTIKVKDVEQDGRLVNIETKNTEQDNRLTTIETKDIEQDNRLTSIEGINTTQNNRLDALEVKDIVHESRMTNIETKNTEQDNRLDIAENRLANISNDITNTMQPIIDEHTSRLDTIEAIDVAQNNRLDAIEAKNQQQDDRLLDIEKVNKRQDIDLKCLFTEAKNNMMDIIEEGNSVYLQNSTTGHVFIDELKGNTLVNCNKEPDKELILNGNINTSGDNNITLTEGVDGGLVDVALEGNTLVNVSKTKDSTAITIAYTVENSGNHIALQGDVDGSCRPVVTGNTLVNLCKLSNTTVNIAHLDNPTRITGTVTIINAFKTNQVRINRYNISDNTFVDTTLITSNVFKLDIPTGQYLDRIYDDTSTDFIPPSTLVSDVLILEGDWTDKPIPDYFEGLQSTFEDNLVTQEMVDSGEEVADNLGKYKVEYKVTGKNKFKFGDLSGDYLYRKTYIPKGTYTISSGCIKQYEGDQWISFEGKSGNVIGNASLITGKTITFNEDIYLIRFYSNGWSWDDSKDKVIDFTNIQIEEGDTATSYESYKEHTKTLYLNSPALEGDIIEEKDNGIYHVHRSELTTYTEGDETSLITDKVNTLHGLETPTYELIEQSNLVVPSYTNGHLDFNTAVPVEKVEFKAFSEELTYLYANTQYTVQFVSDKATTANITLGGTSLLAQSIVAGLNRISITIPETLVDNKLIISGVGANISEVVVTDTDKEFGYFEGMKSVGEGNEIEIEVQNKNLFNKNKLKNGTFVTFNGKECYKYYDSNNANYQYVDDFKKNTSYTYTLKVYRDEQFNNDTYGYKVKFHYTDGTKDVTILTPNTTHSITSNGNKTLSYISGAWHYSENIYIDLSTVQIEEGSTATAYISHQSNTQHLTHESLRAVGNAKDKYVLIDGKWYIKRNCQQIAFTKNIDYWIDSENDTFIIFQCAPTFFTNIKECSIVEKNVIIDKKVSGLTITPQTIWIKFNKDVVSNVESLKNHLPMNLVIPVATPTYEPIDYNPLEVYSDITHISTNSTIPTNITVKNHGYNCLLKPNTTYTVSSNLGLNTVTTGADIGDSCLRFMDTDTSDVTTMKDVLVLEGDWTTKPGLIPANFSGIESAFEQELVTDENDEHYGKYKVTAKVVGKNLFKFGSALSGGIVRLENTDGTPILKAGTYTISSNCEKVYEDNPYIALLDANNTTIKMSNRNLMDNITFSSACDIQVIFLYCNGYNYDQSIGKDYTFTNIQIEQGNTATEYEPYKENNITFYINEPLRGVGDVKDKVYVKDDKVVVERNCGSRPYEDGDFGTYPTDKINTVYPLAEPTYEEIEYNDTKLLIETFKNSTLSYNSNVPVTSKLYYSYSVPLVDKVAQTADISDQQDSMIIDMATQVAVMEIMLM